MDNCHMMKEIERQGCLKKTVENVEASMLTCFANVKSMQLRRIIITGSGDSYYIGLSVRRFFQEMCPGCEVEIISSMEFAKYALERADAQTVVIAVSISGNVQRTIECVEKAQNNGAYVIGITNNPSGQLANTVRRPVLLSLDTEPTWTCGTLTYMGSLYALIRIAITLSNREKDEKDKQLDSLNRTLDLIHRVLDESKDVCRSAARNMYIIENKAPIFVLGVGPNYGTAKYGAAKFMEVCSTLGIGEETEEFCHCQFWVIDRANPVFVIAPSGRGLERSREIASIIRRYGCDLFVISDDEEMCALGKFSVRLPAIPEVMSPLLCALPLQLVAYYYSYDKGLNPDTRDHTDPFRKTCSRILTRGRDMVL